MARSSRIPRAPVHRVWISPRRDCDALLSEVREQTQRGFRVHVTRAGDGAFEVVQNGTCFMVRTLDGDAVATHDNVAAALAAGDRHIEYLPRVDGDDSPDFPRGAA